jgi:hypothetical protein
MNGRQRRWGSDSVPDHPSSAAVPVVSETGHVRLYLPATLVDLAPADGLRPTAAHAVTPQLAAALPGEDDEALEFSALLAAADGSVELLAASPTAPRRRVVVVAEVPGAARDGVPGGPPSEVVPPVLVRWSEVVSLHVDEAAAEADVAPAASGDGDALERVAERDLLWYDASELDVVRRLTG